MTQEHDADYEIPLLDGPQSVDDTLIFELRDDAAARSAWDEYMHGTDTHRGVSAVCEYVMGGRPEGATLSALYRERALHAWEGRGWEIAVPAPRPTRAEVNLSAVHYLRLNDPADGAWLLAELSRDRRVRRVYRPPIHYPLDAPVPVLDGTDIERIASGADVEAFTRLAGRMGLVDFGSLAQVARLLTLLAKDQEQWALEVCGFRGIWDELDAPVRREGGIAVIDKGGYTGHPELAGRITEIKVLPQGMQPSRSNHATAVAAVISALRDPPGGIAGCCSAPIDLYNVASNRRIEPTALCTALKKVRESSAKVVNLSIGSRAEDPTIKEQIRECIQAGLVVVAAAGNVDELGPGPVYPAAFDDVIGVGATDPAGNRVDWSSSGKHVDISAPGLFILSADGKDGIRFWSGTSFATPMVSAAVWLALGARSEWGRDEIVSLLENSSTGRGRRVRDLGFGVLDMGQLALLARAGRTELNAP